MNTIFEWSKFDKTPHWRHETIYLGEDEHGLWFRQLEGSYSSRPGMDYNTETPVLFLVDREGNWVAKIFPPNRDDHMLIYIDIASQVVWNEETLTVTGIDMDLDVIKLDTGKMWIEDEDEFLDHTQTMGYSDELVSVTQETAKTLLDKVVNNHAPFDGKTHLSWGFN